MIPEKLAQYVDLEGYELIQYVFEEVQQREQPYRPAASMALQKVVDMTDKVIGSFTIGSSLNDHSDVLKRCLNGRCAGLKMDGLKRFGKLVMSMASERNLKALVTASFIEKRAFDWLMSAHENKKVDVPLSQFIESEVEAAVKTYTVHFSILNLDIDMPFSIGLAKFGYFTKEYFDAFEAACAQEKGVDPNAGYKHAREKYQGKVFVACQVKAEAERAAELALVHCCLAVDVLKICSDTLDDPTYKLSFDIDRRVRENLMSEVILREVDKMESFLVTYSRQPNHHIIRRNEFARMLSRDIRILDHFIKTVGSNPSELEKLIVNAIRRLGDAMSNSLLHQRVVELFTILESLVVENTESRILDSLTKYCSKLVFKKVKDRIDAIVIIKGMYGIRSAWVHHAKASHINPEHMRKLQLLVMMVLLKFISKCRSGKNKKEILGEIDAALLAAG